MSVSAADAQALRLIARRTWRFFETFVTAADHMLPPDNFQEDPVPVLAHRTSPTNLGLYLLSAAAARDFAWLGTAEAAERLEATLATMGSLARFRGHFYNWYDTRDLRPLDPPYVSTVDSGNLAGHLIALANACREWTVLAPTAARRLAGIADALDLAREATDQLRDGRRTQTVTWHQLDDDARRTCGWRASGRSARDIVAAHWPTSRRRPRSWPTSRPHSRSERATTPARTCCSGWRRRAARSRVTGATSASRRRPPPP